MQVVLQTWPDEDDADVMYSYQIVKQENTKTEDDEYIVYRELGPLRYKVCGRYDYLLDAVKGLYSHMKNEVYEDV
jgi:hypothetical protein